MEAQQIVPQAAAVSTAEDLPASLDAVNRALAQATNDFERARVRTVAEAIKAAALVMEKKDIAANASILVAKAEREIAKHNPPKPRGGWDHVNKPLQSPPAGGDWSSA